MNSPTTILQQEAKKTIAWQDMLPHCSIIYHVHVPKTGGTSVLGALTEMDNYILANERANIYVARGSGVRKTLVPELKKSLGLLGATKRRTNVVTSNEVGIEDLIKHGYPFWNETCFFG